MGVGVGVWTVEEDGGLILGFFFFNIVGGNLAELPFSTPFLGFERTQV